MFFWIILLLLLLISLLSLWFGVPCVRDYHACTRDHCSHSHYHTIPTVHHHCSHPCHPCPRIPISRAMHATTFPLSFSLPLSSPLHAFLLWRRWHSKVDANLERHAVVPVLAISTIYALIVFVASGASIGGAWFSDQLQMASPPQQ